MKPLDDADLMIEGHPVHWLLSRARDFDANFLPHRAPKHPNEDELRAKSPRSVRKALQVYGARVARAIVPVEKQQKAAWGNFVVSEASFVGETF